MTDVRFPKTELGAWTRGGDGTFGDGMDAAALSVGKGGLP